MSEVKPCVKCGAQERYRPNPGKTVGKCVPCTRVRDAAYKAAHREEGRAYYVAYYAAMTSQQYAMYRLRKNRSNRAAADRRDQQRLQEMGLE